MSGGEHTSLAQRWLGEGELRSGSIRQLWQWLADPAQANAARLRFVGPSRAVSRGKALQAAPAKPDPVAEWLPLIARLLNLEPRASSRGRHAAVRHETPAEASGPDPQEAGAGRDGSQAAPTLVLAVLRGLLLDLLATGDRARVQRAFDVFASGLEAISDAARNG